MSVESKRFCTVEENRMKDGLLTRFNAKGDCGEKVQSINEWGGGWRNGSAVRACAAPTGWLPASTVDSSLLSVTPAPGGSDAFCGLWWYQVCIRCTYST